METKPRRGRPRSDKPLVGLSIQLPPELRKRVEAAARQEGRTIAGQIRWVLQRVYGPDVQ